LGGQSGLHELNRITGEHTLYKIKTWQNFLSYRVANHILSLCEGTKNQLWVGAKLGLYIFDKTKKSFSVPIFSNQLYKAGGINNWHIVFVDKGDCVWLANLMNKGLFKYDPLSSLLTCFSYDSTDENTISSNRITKIYQDSKETIWIGTQNGLNKYDKTSNIFKRFYLAGPGDINSRSGAYITDIIEQQNI